jgi:hypothetical protein
MRRSFVPVVLAMVFSASIAHAQGTTAAPPAQQPAAPAPQAAPADPLKFTTDDAVVIFQVQPGKETDFETGFKSMLAALAANAKPELKALGASMTLSKAQIPNPMYLLSIHGVQKNLSYAWGKIIYFSGGEQSATPAMIVEKREDADLMFKQIGDSIVTAGGQPQVSVLPLVKIGG